MNEQDGQLIPRRSDLLPAAVQGSGPPDTAEVPSAAEQPQLLFQPQMDIYETDDGLVLYADLPGVTLDGLELQVQDKKTDAVWASSPAGRRDRSDPAPGIPDRSFFPFLHSQ